VSYGRLGDVSVKEGNLPAARKAYEDGLAIAQELRARDPNNMTWAQDVAISYAKLAMVVEQTNDRAAACAFWREAAAILAALSAAAPTHAALRAQAEDSARQVQRLCGAAE
jgi:hypothetical protein